MRSRNFRVIFGSATVAVVAAIAGSGVEDITAQKRSRVVCRSRSGVSVTEGFSPQRLSSGQFPVVFDREVCT